MAINYKINRTWILAKIKWIFLLSGLFFLFACIDDYWPEIKNANQAILVIDGMITDQPGPYVIKLSFTSQINYPVINPAVGYTVSIEDNTGYMENLKEVGNGEYTTLSEGISGVPGRRYKLHLDSPGGKKYESTFELLNPAVGIDSIYPEIEYHESPDYEYTLSGFQFYIDTKEAEVDTAYYLWRLTSTYKYNSNYLIRYVYDGEMHAFTDPDSLYTCWKTEQIDQVFTSNTTTLSEPRILKFPLHYVSTEDRELSVRYSLLAEQISLSKAAHIYWKQIREISSEQGTIYARQPYQVRGNIKNINDPDEPVLGYFFAGGISSKRIFVNRPTMLNFNYNTTCDIITEDMYTMLWLWRKKWPLYLIAQSAGSGQYPALPGQQTCVDCTERGGTIIEPDFWINY
ncbi:MAG: DUF4249 domain-containing protein [Bacteroidales bacterium]|nr:DUF4249 domain-containing protein [Bacteroidales bacterium]MCF8403303.1 DUF4249 domain-containing protein [Bacteroidales bacterium]